MASFDIHNGSKVVNVEYPDDYEQPVAGSTGIFTFGFNNKTIVLAKEHAVVGSPTFNFGNVQNIPTRFSTDTTPPVDTTKTGTFLIDGRGGSDPGNPNNRWVGSDGVFGGTSLGLVGTSGVTLQGIRYTSRGGNAGRIQFFTGVGGAINITLSRNGFSATLTYNLISGTHTAFPTFDSPAQTTIDTIINIFGGESPNYDQQAMITVTLNG